MKRSYSGHPDKIYRVKDEIEDGVPFRHRDNTWYVRQNKTMRKLMLVGDMLIYKNGDAFGKLSEVLKNRKEIKQ